MKKNLLLVALGLFLFIQFGCSPKSSPPVEVAPQEETAKEEPAEEEDDGLSPCKKFSDSPRENYLLDQFVLYKDKIKLKDFDAALPMWKEVHEQAPAADGKRTTVFRDGIKIYEYLFNQETDTDKRRSYYEIVMGLYDEMAECYGEAAYISGLKGFDLYYKYNEFASPEESYNFFTASIDELGEETPAFVFNPFTAVLIQRFLNDEIEMEEAQRYAGKVLDLIQKIKTKKSSKDWTGEGWDIVEGYAPVRLEELEGVENFYTCDYYKGKYFLPYQASPTTDCDTLKTIYGRLRWGKCDPDGPELVMLRGALQENDCIEKRTTGPSTAREAYDALSEGRYKEAVQKFEQAAEETDDVERKASYLFIVAKIYYAHLRNFSRSRSYAIKAAELKSNWGEPYILIGKLYASSGPLCGPGRGWDSQIVTWPAIDKWQYARSIDSSVASEAQKLINRYSKYMPTGEDVFQRNLKVGDKFRVNCWIQETTTIRVSKKF